MIWILMTACRSEKDCAVGVIEDSGIIVDTDDTDDTNDTMTHNRPSGYWEPIGYRQTN